MDFILDSIDWDTLREQKRWLLGQESTEADGLIGLIDELQDQAVDVHGLEEAEVYDFEPEADPE